jgi:ABC-type multidrug transport system ATPase subunit
LQRPTRYRDYRDLGDPLGEVVDPADAAGREAPDTEEPVIKADGVEKRYGRAWALRSVSFELDAGELLLVTGPNGSGKTTLLRLIAGLASPTRGTLSVSADRGAVGYLGHEPLVYRDLTGLENLDLYGRLYRIRERRERIGMSLERFGLWEVRNDRVTTYSRGMTQRLALCRALLHDPALLVLDEPFTALDERGAALLDTELAAFAAVKTLVVSTHDPDRIGDLATRRLALA